ncbi:GNAT family acetyltransferase [Penicillium argentinense]|uniref:GNAT family acetyltransferase n=1 Tax=Penicillium argentinense TaxID=1131581 RepID=A0A9W9KLJ6_9EURO|nr:GNAT family acetyltransferase [Penicillium argentinense]KAJ5109888.1 GNAT family acetyltransferase [Penicillium argentinense]
MLRYAKSADLPALADIAAQAMLNDELFVYLCPYRHEHHADFRAAFLRRLKMRLHTPDCVMIVAVEPECSGDEETEHVRGNKLTISGLERTLLSIENHYYNLVSPDRSIDNKRLERYNQLVETGFDFEGISELWFLSTVAVDPVHQRRGLGRLLVQWGLDRAREEQTPVGLEASLQGISLYEKMGFRTVATVEVVPGLTVPAMLWEPERPADGDAQS